MGRETAATLLRLDAGTTSDERDVAAQGSTSCAAGEPVVLGTELTAAGRGRVAALVEQLMPPLSSVMPRGSVLQAHRNAEARLELAERYGVLTSTQLAARAGHGPSSRRSSMLRVIDAAGDRLQGWDLALWFTSSNAWLDGARPVDLLGESPDDVLDAVRSAVADTPG